ncbi:uncharacterized protein LOC123893293 isoform X2 [Trifolium pratense]|uniref:uncharacterized protein LOC123893293 isoform X2 n=1 Tax=Trifolium pratense TaxID=57577 RepID=UPI001E695E08|nr:uncharacterized protein LOC123893293 isoform X2 [Trifolium pratense]
MVELVILMFKDNCLSKFLTKKMHIFKFSITYGDGSTTAGSFVNDSLTFNQVNGNLHNAAENSSVVFGCGAKQSGTLGSSSDEALDGIIGFGQSNSSVLSQLAASGKLFFQVFVCMIDLLLSVVHLNGQRITYTAQYSHPLNHIPEVQAMKWSIRLRPGRFFTVPEELRAPQESQHGDAVMEAFVKGRSGSVLGKGSILKMCSMNPRH